MYSLSWPCWSISSNVSGRWLNSDDQMVLCVSRNFFFTKRVILQRNVFFIFSSLSLIFSNKSSSYCCITWLTYYVIYSFFGVHVCISKPFLWLLTSIQPSQNPFNWNLSHTQVILGNIECFCYTLESNVSAKIMSWI